MIFKRKLFLIITLVTICVSLFSFPVTASAAGIQSPENTHILLEATRDGDEITISIKAASDYSFGGMGVYQLANQISEGTELSSTTTGPKFPQNSVTVNLKSPTYHYLWATDNYQSIKKGDIFFNMTYKVSDGFRQGKNYSYSYTFRDLYDAELEDYTDVLGKTFTVTYREGDDGTETPEVSSFHIDFLSDGSKIVETQDVGKGQVPTVPSDPARDGYTFAGWSPDGGTTVLSKAQVEAAAITADTTYTAVWKKNQNENSGSASSGGNGGSGGSVNPVPQQPVEPIIIKAPMYHGVVDLNGIARIKDEPVVVTVTPDEGYELDHLTVTDSEGKVLDVTDNEDGTHTFIMPDSPKVEVDAVFRETTETEPRKEPEPSTDSDLNRTDHIRYMQGYEDGTVRPSGHVTRAETATMLYRLLTEERRDAIFTAENDFSDVSASLWYNKAVSSMSRGGYLKGYADGTFQGDQKITRAEFAVIISRFGSSETSKEILFLDLDREHWAYQAIAAGVSQGWVHGYEDATFRPDQPITRAEAATMINRYLNRGVSKDSELGSYTGFSDNEPGAWYYYAIVEATNDHVAEDFRPDENWVANTVDHDYDIDQYEKPSTTY